MAYITPAQQLKVSGKVAFNKWTYERDSSHNAFLRRTRQLLASGASAQAIKGLAREFSALNPELRAGIYQSIVARLFTGYSSNAKEIIWYKLEKSPEPWYPYVPQKTPLTFKGHEVEKINSLLRALEEHLELEHPQGYRFTWIPSKGMMLAGVAREYECRGVPVRDYLFMEDIPKVLGEDLAGLVEEGRIILTYFNKSSAFKSNCLALFESEEPSHREIANVLKIVLDSIPGALESFRPVNRSRDYFDLKGDVYDPLAHAVVRAHEYGHVVSLRKDPRIIPTLEAENISIQALFYINSLSEILADLEGPAALIAEAAISDAPMARQLFWALTAKTFMFAAGIGGFSPLGRFNNEFMLRFLISQLIPKADRPDVNLEKLSAEREHFCRRIYEQFVGIARLLEQPGGALDAEQTEDIKYQALKLVDPREMFGSLALNYHNVAISFFERYSNIPPSRHT